MWPAVLLNAASIFCWVGIILYVRRMDRRRREETARVEAMSAASLAALQAAEASNAEARRRLDEAAALHERLTAREQDLIQQNLRVGAELRQATAENQAAAKRYELVVSETRKLEELRAAIEKAKQEMLDAKVAAVQMEQSAVQGLAAAMALKAEVHRKLALLAIARADPTRTIAVLPEASVN